MIALNVRKQIQSSVQLDVTGTTWKGKDIIQGEWQMKKKKELNKFEQEKIKRIKERLEPVNAAPIIELAQHVISVTENTQPFAEAIKKSFAETGAVALDAAFTEGVITEEEWKDWQKRFGVGTHDIAPALQAYYNMLDGKLPDGVVVVTMENSPLHKLKHILLEKLDVLIITAEEANELIEEEKRKNE